MRLALLLHCLHVKHIAEPSSDFGGACSKVTLPNLTSVLLKLERQIGHLVLPASNSLSRKRRFRPAWRLSFLPKWENLWLRNSPQCNALALANH